MRSGTLSSPARRSWRTTLTSWSGPLTRRERPWPHVALMSVLVLGALGWGLSRVLQSAPQGYGALLDTWDGRNFLAIAADGYPSRPARDGNGVISNARWAFFPVFPYLLRGVTGVTDLPMSVVVPAVNGWRLCSPWGCYTQPPAGSRPGRWPRA